MKQLLLSPYNLFYVCARNISQLTLSWSGGLTRLLTVTVFLSLYAAPEMLLAQVQPQSIRENVIFQWADTQNVNSDPITIESITIDGDLYNNFTVPIGYELSRLGPDGHGANNLRLNGVDYITSSNDPTWDANALLAFQDLNLNHKFESNANGRNICEDFNAAATTDAQEQTLFYDEFQIVNRGSVIAITERGANNCFYIEIIGSLTQGGSETLLGSFFVRENDGGFNTYDPPVPPAPGGDYWWSNRNNANGQVLGIALFRLDEIAPVGSFVTKVRFVGTTADHGDGKVFIMRQDAADVGVLKEIDNPAPLTGEEITFTITATNFGPIPATNVVVEDQLPSGYTYISHSESTGTYDNATGVWNIGSMSLGAVETLTITATVLDEGDFVNFASITADQDDPNLENNISGSSPHFGTGECPEIEISRVQWADGDDSSSQIATFGTQPTVGNLIVAASFHDGSGTSPTISGAGWSDPIVNTYLDVSGSTRGMSIWYKVAGLSEPSSISTSWAPGSDNRLLIQEFSISGGTVSVSDVIFDIDNSGNNLVNSLSNLTTGTISENTLLVGILGTRENTGSNPPSWDQDLADAVGVGNNGSRSLWSAFEYSEGQGTKQSTVTWNTSRHATAALLAFDVIPATPIAQPALAVVQPSCENPFGSITINFPTSVFYEYSIDGGDTWQDSNVFSDISSGTYTVTVRDKITGCINSVNTTLTGVSVEVCGECPLPAVLRVQSAEGDGSNSQTATFSQTPVEGNLIVAASFHRQDGTVPTISGTGWSGPVIDLFAVPGGEHGTPSTLHRRGMAVWYKIAGESEPTSITTSWGPASQNRLLIQEFEIVGGTVTTTNVVSATNNSGADEVSTLSTGTTPAPTAIYNILVGFLGSRENTGSSPNWADSDLTGTIGSGGTRSLWSAFQLSSAPGTQESTASWSSNVRATAALIGLGVIPFTPPPAPELLITQLNCDGDLGIIEVISPHGTEFEYRINEGTWQSSPIFTDLNHGNYEITVRNTLTECISPVSLAILEEPVCDADLAISKDVNDPTPNVGDEIIFTINVTNNGPAEATNVLVTDQLPNGYTYVGSSTNPDDDSYDVGTGTWEVGTLSVGATATLTITATVNQPGPGVEYVNTASVAADQFDPDLTNNSSDQDIDPQVNLQICVTKTADPRSYSEVGDVITYTIRVCNSGNVALYDIIVDDPMISSITNQNIGDLAPGGTITLTGSYTITQADVDEAQVINTASASGTDDFGNTVSNTSTANVYGALIFEEDGTFTVPDCVTEITVEVWGAGGGGAGGVSGPSTSPEPGGGGGGGGYARITIPVVPGQTFPFSVGQGGQGGEGEYTPVYDFPGGQSQGEDGGNTWFASVTTVFAEGGKGAFNLGDDLASPGGAGGSANIGDVIFNGGTGGAGFPSQGPPSQRRGGGGGGSAFSDDDGGDGQDGDRNAGGTGGIGEGDGGDGRQGGIPGNPGLFPGGGGGGAGGVQGGPIYEQGGTGADGLIVVTFAESVYDLSLSTEVTNLFPNIGETVIFTLIVNNDGPNDATGVEVQNEIPSGLGNISFITGGGTLIGSSIIWENIAVDVGNPVALSFQAEVQEPTGVPDEYRNVAEITDLFPSINCDPNPNNNADEVTLTPPLADLAIEKTVDPDEDIWTGDEITFTITVTNHGPADATGVVVNDQILNGFSYDSHSATDGTFDPVTGMWTIGDLDLNDSATLDITVTVNIDGDYRNMVSVSANEFDIDLFNNYDSIEVEVRCEIRNLTPQLNQN